MADKNIRGQVNGNRINCRVEDKKESFKFKGELIRELRTIIRRFNIDTEVLK